MGGGAEGRAAMANWLKGGFEMDRKGDWRLKPQIADTLQRDVQAIMAQTGWERSIGRAAQDQNVFNITTQGEIAGTTISTGGGTRKGRSGSGSGRVGGSLAVSSQESG
jgi:conjugal transfer mating pair stabilization protein TraG